MRRKRKLKIWVKILLCILIGGGCISLFFMACGKTKNSSGTEPASVPAVTKEETTKETATKEPEVTTEEIKTPDYEEVIDFNADYPFMVKVNRAENFVAIYGMDQKGKYTIPYKVFICSTAKEPEDTPLGTFEISEKKRWNFMVDATYTQYAIRVYGQIMLHSIPYEEMSNDTLLYEEYNKLGTAASHGCIRMQVNDVKWIFANCPEGTPVKIYSKKNEEPPLPLPPFEQIDDNDSRKGWDPTDPDTLNPWNQ